MRKRNKRILQAMRKIKSLIKQHGGFNRFKKAHIGIAHENILESFIDFIYNSHGRDALCNMLYGVVDKKEKLEGLSEIEMLKIGYAVAKELEKIIEDAYSFACKNESSFDCIFLFPECVVEAFVINAIFLDTIFKRKKGTNKVYDEITKIKFHDEQALLIDSMLAEFSNYFSFADSPENLWWNAFYDFGFRLSSREDDMKISHNVDFYKGFIEAHSECKEEIKEFCKQ